MADIKDIDEIESVIVHWSEGPYINDVLCCDENGDIEKEVDKFALDSIIKVAASDVGLGYDKISMSLKFKDDERDYSNVKFYLTPSRDSLVKLLNSK